MRIEYRIVTISFIISNICFCIKATSQNLVPNWSFEDTVTCPDNLGQMDRAIGWSSYRVTPDYFNACADTGGITNVSVPRNIFDYQIPKTGNAYAGFHAFAISAGNVREFIGISLINPLLIGHEYFASFYVSRCGSISQRKNIATNKIGIKFSTVLYSTANPISNNNDAMVFTDSIVTDTLNWTEISGFFIADSAYQYLSIGNFFTDSATSYLRFDTISGLSYYFVDDVILKDSISMNIPEIQVPKLISSVLPRGQSISIVGNCISDVALFDSIGRICVKEQYYCESSIVIHMPVLSRGIYIIKINIRNKSFYKKLLIV